MLRFCDDADTVEDGTVGSHLLVKPAQRVSVALDFVSGEVTIDHSDVRTKVTMK